MRRMMKRLKEWRLYWLAWGLLALYFASMDALLLRRSFWSYLPLNLTQMACWGLLGLVIVHLARRYPIEGLRLRPLKPWLIHVPASAVLAGVGTTLAFLLSLTMTEGVSRWDHLRLLKHFERFVASYYHTSLFNLWVVLGAYQMVLAHRRYRQRELDTAQLEGRLAQAQNQALRMQLQPHFLFNTLNGISTLIQSDPETADRMVTRLADLLRMSLDLGSRHEVSLRQELAFIEAYLAIESLRFRERLQVRLDAPVALLEARVPTFLLQPLVENAIQHGLARRGRGGTLRVAASREEDWLVLDVVDDGVGFQVAYDHIGLKNTRERLQVLYGARHALDISSRPGEGTWVHIRIPFSADRIEA